MIQELLAVSVPPQVAKAGWIFDAKAIVTAKQHLSIDYPVRFRFITGKHRYGTHYARIIPDEHHLITVDQNHELHEANRTIWHELAHAAQSETFARETGKTHNLFYKTWYQPQGQTGNAYWNNVFEVDARQVAQDNQYTMLLRMVK